jgi:Zn-dependent protease/CBS domain-containing protein
MMRSGFGIGRIFGINVRIDWSWLLIFLLVTWNLATLFTQIHPDWGAILRWSLAIVASLLFFLSVLAHELAHSLTARARGIPVHSITLFLFGGVSNIQREPTSARAEFLIAIVGPLTSIVIGAVLLLITGAVAPAMGNITNPMAAFGRMSPAGTIIFWLGSVNILVGLFNLIPAFPLDGGRVLRSFFWALTNSLRKATRYASWIGQIIAWLFIIAGIAMTFGVNIPYFGTGLVSGIWLAFIGWFLNTAASQSYQQVVIQDILGDVPVHRLMRSDPPTTSQHITIDELVNAHVMRSDEHAFPVMENDRLIGMVTLDDIRKVPREEWGSRTVKEIMTPAEKLETVSLDDNSADALKSLSQRDVNQLPVMSNGRMVGLLRRRDVVRWLQINSEQAAVER